MLFAVLSTLLLGFLLVRYLWLRRHFYRLSWHMPGPFALPLIGNALMFVDASKVMQKLEQLSAAYQKCYRFWLGTRLLVMFQSPDMFEVVMNSSHAMDKGNVYKIVGNSMGGNGLITSSGGAWKAHRKLLNPTIQNFKILNSFYPTFNRNMRVLVERMEQWAGGEAFDAYRMMEACSLDLICETTFGTKMHVQDGQNVAFLEHANNLMHVAGLIILQPWFQIETIFRWSKWYAVKERSKIEARSFARGLIEQKIAEFEKNDRNNNNNNNSNNNSASDEENVGGDGGAGGQRRQLNNFIDECVRLSLEEKCFSRDDMVNESVTMLLGGFETTATTVSYIVLMLAMHPDYQQRVFDEIHAIIPTRLGDVTAEHLGRLDYTNRFIKESMRLNPTVPFVSRIAKNDFQIDGQTIPRGTELMMCIYSLHRHRSVWGPHATSFDPDHFLPERLAERHPYAFIPFSAGPRNCIGLKYGHIVIRMFVCWLVRSYRFTTPLRLADLRYRMSVTLKLTNGHMVRAERRHTY